MQLSDQGTVDRREQFFRILFGDNEGFLCIARRVQGKGAFEEQFFKYPGEMPKVLEFVDASSTGFDVWFCPMLLRGKKRSKEYVDITPAVWSDLDTCEPEKLLLKPTITVESSPGRWQALWVMADGPLEPDIAEKWSKRIAYYHAEQGADRSGWDLTQLLRVPYTYNNKYESAPLIRIVDTGKRISLSDLEAYPEVAELSTEELPFPEELPYDNAEDVIRIHRARLHPAVYKLFSDVPEADWSKPLFNLEMMLFETGLTREEVFLVVREAACNKYRRDNRSDKLLWREVCRAGKMVADRQAVSETAFNNGEIVPLLTPEEILDTATYRTFIEDYTEWASSLGDAAEQYHEVGAFIILSAILASRVHLPTSFGDVVPNLWFMLLADTTLTRKTTAMDIAMDLLVDIDSDCVLATDGSIEGLFGSLATRPKRASVFLRDEFSGLLEAMTKRDYMAGMAETLTKLYDGKYQKRILRKEVMEVKDPVLIIFAGGIKSRILQLLQHEHVSSGFLPRFVFASAVSDTTRLRPLGPPSERSLAGRETILGRLRILYEAFNRQMETTALGVTIQTQKTWAASLTPEAWERYNKFELDMVDSGMKSSMQDLLMPMMDRLSKSGLKAAVLLAAERQVGQEQVVVEVKDLVKAFSFIDKWREYAFEIIRNVGISAGEKQIQNVYEAIRRASRIQRSTLMQSYHLTKRDMDIILDTLEQRNLINRVREGRSEMITPVY